MKLSSFDTFIGFLALEIENIEINLLKFCVRYTIFPSTIAFHKYRTELKEWLQQTNTL